MRDASHGPFASVRDRSLPLTGRKDDDDVKADVLYGHMCTHGGCCCWQMFSYNEHGRFVKEKLTKPTRNCSLLERLTSTDPRKPSNSGRSMTPHQKELDGINKQLGQTIKDYADAFKQSYDPE